MVRWAFGVFAVCAAALAAAQGGVYRQTDESGAPEFTDRPAPGAEAVELPAPNVVPAPRIELPFTVPAARPEPIKYRLRIAAPPPDATVFILEQLLEIRVEAVPPPRTDLGHRLQILFDDAVLAEDVSQFVLDDAERGTHRIGARIVDAEGRTIAEAETVAVHVKRPMVRR